MSAQWTDERELETLVRLVFTLSGREGVTPVTSRVTVENDDPQVDREAAVLLARLVPTLPAAPSEGAADRLVGMLWEASGGDLDVASRMIRRTERVERRAVLTQLARGLDHLVEARIGELTPARAALEARRRLLPRRAEHRPAAPQRTIPQRDDQPIPAAVRPEQLSVRSIPEILAELATLPGLGHVHQQVRRLVSRIEVEHSRHRDGLPVVESSRHLALVGPPGTGKTMVARLVAEAYMALGLVEKRTFIEAGRAALTGMYTGHTTHRTAETVSIALGGVLFIDEAYSLSGDVFAAEALAELVRLIENHRHELGGRLAGYPAEMAHLDRANPGLASRVGDTLRFDPYDDDALWEILDLLAAEAGYVITPDAREPVQGWLADARDTADFANARTARSLLEHMVVEHAARIYDTGTLSGDDLFTLTASDLPPRRKPDQPAPLYPTPSLGYL